MEPKFNNKSSDDDLTQTYSFLQMFIMPPANDLRFTQSVLGQLFLLLLSRDDNSLQVILSSSSQML